MKAVVDLQVWLEDFAPLRLAEEWDNIGLLWGDPAAAIEKVMTCLTVTPATAAEAIEQGAGLIVSHHPVLFRPTQKVTKQGSDPHRYLWDLARASVSIYSPHTAFDNCTGGINDTLAELLGLIDVAPLRPARTEAAHKIVVFTPEADLEAVRGAAFDAGAGRIGEYRECSFGAPGIGTFFGEEAANPAVGEKGRRESAPEWRLEILCPASRLAAAMPAIRKAHSYEEPAIDVYPLHVEPRGPGIGRSGRLPEPMPLGELVARVAALLHTPGVQYAGEPERVVERVAIACGAGDDFLREAWSRADVLLTGEARFHRALEAESMGLGLIAAGHHATERVGVDRLAARLADAFPDLDVWASREERDPWRVPRA